MKIRVKAPLRLGIGGGGTDVSPYSDIYSGAVLNATINMYAYTYLETNDGDSVRFTSLDLKKQDSIDLGEIDSTYNGELILHHAVYCRVIKQFNKGIHIPLFLSTYCDAPAGSGLGSSSSLVVSMLEAFRELLSLPLGEYDIAKLAYEIERVDCGLSGGKQDQYAACFGGFNFIEFGAKGLVVVNPLRIRRHIINELEASTILYFTGVSRKSAEIIEDQITQIEDGGNRLEAMHELKKSALRLKASLLRGSISELAIELMAGWNAKKATSASISNNQINNLEKSILAAGATSMKVSGAGGGGFVMILTDPEKRYDVIESLEHHEGRVVNFEFTSGGVVSWKI
jgi:D-glycero-alpha-D-manno-heptose-7-phosphate kinase